MSAQWKQPTWKSQTVRLYHEDCLRVLAQAPEGCVDAVVTDPPYGIGYESTRGEKIKGDEHPFVWWLGFCGRLLADDGVLVCFTRWDVAEAFRMAIHWAGLKVVGEVIWDKGGEGMGNTLQAPALQHERIWIACRRKYRLPSKRPMSTLRIPKVTFQAAVHPTEKPVELMRMLLESYVAAGKTVLDPCMGSGSTGVACVELGYPFIGCEVDPKHYKSAVQRISKASLTV